MPAALYPATMVAGAMRTPRPAADRRFPRTARLLPAARRRQLSASGHPARGVWLDLPPTRRHLDFTPTIFAQLFEDSAFRAAVGKQPASCAATPPASASRPCRHPPRRRSRRRSRVPGRCAHLRNSHPAPSVPGIRLYTLLAAAFQRAGGRIQIGSWVVRAEAEGDRLLRIYSAAAARQQRHEAAAYLLATGGIAGGGFRTDHTGQIVETALNLPVRAPAARSAWLGPAFTAPHPIHRAGIATDPDLRPLDPTGAPIYTNVTIAGAASAVPTLIREGSYEGVALATGWRAAATLLKWEVGSGK
ncbi:MAG: FAD-binding protein [Chloroflexia bacterium]